MFYRNDLVAVQTGAPPAPIDKLLQSLANDHGAQGIAVLVDGCGNDGVLGIKRLKEVGGLTTAQAPDGDNCETRRSAIASGMIDLVLPLSVIGELLAALGQQPMQDSPLSDSAEGDGVRRGPEELADTLHDFLVLMRIQLLQARDAVPPGVTTHAGESVPLDRGLSSVSTRSPRRDGTLTSRLLDQCHQLLPRPRGVRRARQHGGAFVTRFMDVASFVRISYTMADHRTLAAS